MGIAASLARPPSDRHGSVFASLAVIRPGMERRADPGYDRGERTPPRRSLSSQGSANRRAWPPPRSSPNPQSRIPSPVGRRSKSALGARVGALGVLVDRRFACGRQRLLGGARLMACPRDEDDSRLDPISKADREAETALRAALGQVDRPITAKPDSALAKLLGKRARSAPRLRAQRIRSRVPFWWPGSCRRREVLRR